MRTFRIFLLVTLLFLFNSCQTIENKSQSAIKKENEKLSKFLQQPESELKIVMGEPDDIVYDDKGSKFFIYTKKKYKITCERKFEIDKTEIKAGHAGKTGRDSAIAEIALDYAFALKISEKLNT